jgi:sugar phosphate isomerase/epimerase
MDLDRRKFLAALGAGLAAPAILRAAARAKRYPIAFSTLGCPAWAWTTVLDQAERLGYSAIELRGVAGEMDLPKVPELAGSRLADSRREVAARGLVISDLGASAHMHDKDPAAREKQMDDGRRFIDLAHALGVKYVRMFGNDMPKGEPREDVMNRVVDGFRKMAAYASPAGVTVLIESHGDFVHSNDLAELLTGVGSHAFALLWDAHHTFAAAHEAPADTYAKLGRWVRHTHLKDSRPEGADRRYVLTGSGDVPVKEQVRVLAAGGYKGYYCYEWEKKWHPEIEEPEVAFPHYAKVMGEYLSAAGVKAT